MACLSLTACYDDPDFQITETNNNLNLYEGGVKLDNPYTTANMKMALDTIKAKVTRGEYIWRSNQPRSKTNASTIDGFNVSTSHRYIKFTPQSEDEMVLLKQDSTLHLVDYPLDYEFDDAFYSSRPNLPEGQMPEYFTSVPVGTSLPNVSHEVLAALYIPEDDDFFNEAVQTPVTKKTIINNEEDLLHHLLYEAFVLVGKEGELINDRGSVEDPVVGVEWWFFGRKWRPSGTLRVWDDIGGTTPGGFDCYQGIVGYEYLDCGSDTFVSIYDCTVPIYGTICDPLPPNDGGGFVPLAGAQVLMRQWFTVDSGITDANGNFSTGTVRGEARYVIQWERFEYSIRNGTTFQAETRGPKLKNARWVENIVGGDDEYHAIIHTAAHDYFYGDRFGTKTPPQNEYWPQMKIGAREVNDASGHVPFLAGITAQILPVIHLKAWGDPTDEVYGTTIHELAHAAHRNLDLNTYNNVVWDAYTNVAFTPPLFDIHNPMGPMANNNRRLMETWATTLETLFTRRRYREQFGLVNYTYSLNNFQDRRIIDNIHYTSAGIDMLEGNYGLPITNQNTLNNQRPLDRVNGYTINQLEDALIDASSWWEWRERIFNIDPNNPTRNNLDELFNNW